jgi:hypothetical protein
MATTVGGRVIAAKSYEMRRLAHGIGVVQEELTPEPTTLDKVAKLRAAHRTLGEELDVTEQRARAVRWEGVKLSGLKNAEKCRAVADLGYETYAQRIADEYRR